MRRLMRAFARTDDFEGRIEDWIIENPSVFVPSRQVLQRHALSITLNVVVLFVGLAMAVSLSVNNLKKYPSNVVKWSKVGMPIICLLYLCFIFSSYWYATGIELLVYARWPDYAMWHLWKFYLFILLQCLAWPGAFIIGIHILYLRFTDKNLDSLDHVSKAMGIKRKKKAEEEPGIEPDDPSKEESLASSSVEMVQTKSEEIGN